MLLQCEIESGAGAAYEWLTPELLGSLLALNESCLRLLAEQALASAAANPLLQLFAEHWGQLDGAAQRRVAACPYLLLDAGFAEPLRWRSANGSQVGDVTGGYGRGFFSVPAARVVARLVFTFAWHVVRSGGPAARVLLGVPAPSALAIGQHTLPQIQALGETHPHWLRPRWPTQLAAWRELLLAAAVGEGPALALARRRGVPLLAAEARLAAPPAPRSGGC
jgi:hypothetical protein